MATAAAQAGKSTAPKRNNAAHFFGYDVFISFALGPAPRGTQSYASDLARRLRERDFTVFFSEDEASPGEQLDSTLLKALFRSRILVVIANRGTLREPRWVRQEVEQFSNRHPDRPIVPISVGGAFQDPSLAEQTREWLKFDDTIWLDESESAVAQGIASEELVTRLALAPAGRSSNVKWRWVVRAVLAVLLVLTIAATGFGIYAQKQKVAADKSADDAKTQAAIAEERRHDAEAARSLEKKAREAETAARKEAEANAKEANRQKLIAEEQRDTALSRELIANSIMSLPADPALSLLLSRQAARIKKTDQVEQSLRQSILQSHLRRILLGHREAVTGVSFSHDGKRLVTTAGGVGERTDADDLTARIWDASTGQLLRELKGHTGHIHHAEFSPDGMRVLTVGDFAARIWDAESGALLFTLKGGDDFQVQARFSPDGKLVVTAGRKEGSASNASLGRVWDTATGKLVAELKGHTDALTDATFGADSRLVVTGGFDDAARLWEARTGRMWAELKGHKEVVTSVKISPDGKRVATTSWDKTARLWDENGKPIATLVHADPVLTAAFSPDSRLLATAGRDGTVRIWSAKSGRAVAELRGHTGAVNSLEFSANGEWMVSASDDGTARIWQARTPGAVDQQDADMFDQTKQVAWRNTAVLAGHVGAVKAAAFHPDSRQVATAGVDRTVRLWEPHFWEPLRVVEANFHDKPLFSTSGLYMITSPSSAFDPARIWSLSSGMQVAESAPHAEFSPDERWAVTSQKDVSKIWDTRTWTAVATILGSDAKFSPDGNWVMTTVGDHSLVWRTGNWTKETELPGRGGTFRSDGALICGFADGTLTVWRTYSWRVSMAVPKNFSDSSCFFSSRGRLTTFGGDGYSFWDSNGTISALVPKSSAGMQELSPDGKYAVRIYSSDLEIYETRSGRLATKIPVGHPEAIAISPKGKYVGAALPNGTARLWELGTWRSLSFHGHRAAVHDLAFSPDERFLATAGEDRSAVIWDIAAGQAVAELHSHTDGVDAISFSRDGLMIATASEDHTAHVFRCDICVPLERLAIIADSITARSLTPAERSRYLHDRSVDQSDAARLMAQAWQLASAGEITLATEMFQRANQAGAKLSRPARREAEFAAAESLLNASTLHAQRLEIDVALQERRRAKALEPGLVKDADREVAEIAGRVLIARAEQSAREGKLATAESLLRRAQLLDASKAADPSRQVRTWAAEPLRRQAEQIASTGDAAATMALLRKAAVIDPAGSQNLTQETAVAIANAEKRLLSDIERLDTGGQYKELLLLVSEHPWISRRVTQNTWLRLCSFGVMENAELVLPACERAVEMDPHGVFIRRNRGAARALTGDLKGAADDLEWASQREEDANLQKSLARWAAVLRHGSNPFLKPGTQEADPRIVSECTRN